MLTLQSAVHSVQHLYKPDFWSNISGAFSQWKASLVALSNVLAIDLIIRTSPGNREKCASKSCSSPFTCCQNSLIIHPDKAVLCLHHSFCHSPADFSGTAGNQNLAHVKKTWTLTLAKRLADIWKWNADPSGSRSPILTGQRFFFHPVCQSSDCSLQLYEGC